MPRKNKQSWKGIKTADRERVATWLDNDTVAQLRAWHQEKDAEHKFDISHFIRRAVNEAIKVERARRGITPTPKLLHVPITETAPPAPESVESMQDTIKSFALPTASPAVRPRPYRRKPKVKE